MDPIQTLRLECIKIALQCRAPELLSAANQIVNYVLTGAIDPTPAITKQGE